MRGFLSSLFSVNPGAPTSDIKLGFAFALAIVLLLAFFLIPLIRRKTQNKPLRKILARSRGGALAFSLCFFFLVWFRLEQVPYLSMRFWFYLTLLGLLVWLALKVRHFTKIRERIERAESRRITGG